MFSFLRTVSGRRWFWAVLLVSGVALSGGQAHAFPMHGGPVRPHVAPVAPQAMMPARFPMHMQNANSPFNPLANRTFFPLRPFNPNNPNSLNSVFFSSIRPTPTAPSNPRLATGSLGASAAQINANLQSAILQQHVPFSPFNLNGPFSPFSSALNPNSLANQAAFITPFRSIFNPFSTLFNPFNTFNPLSPFFNPLSSSLLSTSAAFNPYLSSGSGWGGGGMGGYGMGGYGGGGYGSGYLSYSAPQSQVFPYIPPASLGAANQANRPAQAPAAAPVANQQVGGQAAAVALPELTARLQDKDPVVQWRAVVLLGRMGAEAKPAVPALTKLLHSSDSSARWVAAYALSEIGPAAQSASATLTDTLSDPDPTVRRMSAKALALVGPNTQAVRDALAQAARDSNPDVSSTATVALQRLSLSGNQEHP